MNGRRKLHLFLTKFFDLMAEAIICTRGFAPLASALNHASGAEDVFPASSTVKLA
jgi:hypothetical protein